MGASREDSPRYREDDTQDLLPLPSSCTTPTRPVNPTDPYLITYVQTDTSSFKQVVQMLTGVSKKPNYPNPTLHSIPPIKAVSNKKQPSSSRLYERRNSMKHFLKINPTHSGLPQILSPSILHIPSPVLSPVTPLMPDPFNRSVAVDDFEGSEAPTSPSLSDDFDSLATSTS